MSGVTIQTVGKDDDNIRLDRWFKRHYQGVPFSRLSKAFRKGEVRLDGKRVKGNERIQEGQEIRVPPFGDNATQSRAKEKVLHLDDATIADDDATAGDDGMTADDDATAVSRAMAYTQ